MKKTRLKMKLRDNEIKGIGSFKINEFLEDVKFEKSVFFVGKFCNPDDPFIQFKEGDILDLKDENGKFIGKGKCIKKDKKGAEFQMVKE